MPDTEPENYSIDEMMDRLRTRSEGGGGSGDEPELVTRADGSQMYKVRKRKRRSHQPKKEAEKRKSRFQIVQVVTAGAVIGLLGIGFVGSLVYLNSSAFRSKISTQIEAWTGAKAETTEFRLTPISVAAKSVHLSWPEGSALESFKAYEINGDVDATSYFSSPWKGREITAKTGTLTLRAPGAVPAATAVAREGFVPFQFRYRSPHFNLIGGKGEIPAFQVNDTEASFTVVNQEGTKANLQLEGGIIQLANWGAYAIRFASLQVEQGDLRLGTARLGVPNADRAEIEINDPSGSPISLSGGAASAYEVRASRVPFASLVGKGFSDILGGDVDTPTGTGNKNGTLSFAYGSKDPLSLTLPFRANTSGTMIGGRLPMFTFLADKIGNADFRIPKFDLDARGTLYRDSAGIRLEDLSLDTHNFVSLTGRIAADPHGNLSGDLDVGIQESFASEAGPAFLATFNRRARGMVWASVKVSGTLDNPQDDLATKIHGAGGGQDAEWDDLTTPGKKDDKR